VIDLVVDSDADTVVIEGSEDLIDDKILDSNGQRLALRQAKSRQEPGTRGLPGLARILCVGNSTMQEMPWSVVRLVGCHRGHSEGWQPEPPGTRPRDAETLTADINAKARP
jgi:hypothetical protein